MSRTRSFFRDIIDPASLSKRCSSWWCKASAPYPAGGVAGSCVSEYKGLNIVLLCCKTNRCRPSGGTIRLFELSSTWLWGSCPSEVHRTLQRGSTNAGPVRSWSRHTWYCQRRLSSCRSSHLHVQRLCIYQNGARVRQYILYSCFLIIFANNSTKKKCKVIKFLTILIKRVYF